MPVQNTQNWELRSGEVQELIGQVPHFIVRWGITVFFFVLIAIVFASWLIHYPDIVKAPFKLTSTNAPKAIHTKTDGKLIKLLVLDNTTVSKNEVLAYMESTADHAEVLTLMSWLDTLTTWIDNGQIERLRGLHKNNYKHLGELQGEFQTFNQAYTELLAFLTNGFFLAKKQILQRELKDLMHLESNLQEQKVIYQRDFELAQQEFEVQQQLAREKVIAALEYKREESKLLARKMPLKQVESAIINNRAGQSAKQQELLELDKLIAEQQSTFIQSLNTLRSAAESWKQKYVLVAPLDGSVHFTSIIEENQHLAANEEVFFVAPKTEAYFGTLRVPQQNFGKVKHRQVVLIKFSSYPYPEFGAVKGEIEFISQIPGKDSTFLAKVHLPDGLNTNFGRKITYKPGINAVGEIITEDQRLIEKIFYNFRKALER